LRTQMNLYPDWVRLFQQLNNKCMEMDFLGRALFRQETIYVSRYRMALEREFININKFAWPDPN
jgi:hypothetical protein